MAKIERRRISWRCCGLGLVLLIIWLAVAHKHQSRANSRELTGTSSWSLAPEAVQKILQATNFEGKDRQLLWVTFSSSGYGDMLLNWVAHVKRLGLPYLVVALDAKVAALCEQEDAFYILHDNQVGQGLQRDNFRKFRAMGAQKPRMVLQLMSSLPIQGVVLSDVDVVWLKSPHAYFAGYPEADVMISTDCLSHEAEEEAMRGQLEIAGGGRWQPSQRLQEVRRCGHIPGSTRKAAFNTGAIVFHDRPATRQLLEEWLSVLSNPRKAVDRSTGYKVTDQLALNLLLTRGMQAGDSFVRCPADERLLMVYGGKVKLLALPVLKFPGGHVQFVQHSPERYGVQPFLVHATYQAGGLEGKVARFREAGMWLLDNATHFSQPVLTYHNGVKDWMAAMEEVHGDVPQLQKHFWAAAYQIALFRDALALSSVLQRMVALPPWVCYCDWFWHAEVMEECKLPDSDTLLPFECPTDLFIQPQLLEQLPVRLPGYLNQLQERIQEAPHQLTFQVGRVSLQHILRRQIQLNQGGDASRRREGGLEDVGTDVQVVRVEGLQPGEMAGFDDDSLNWGFNSAIRQVFSEPTWCCSGGYGGQKNKMNMWTFPLPRRLVSEREGHASLPSRGEQPQLWQPVLPARPVECDSQRWNLPHYRRHPSHPCNWLPHSESQTDL